MKTKFLDSPRVGVDKTKPGDVFIWRDVAYMRINAPDADGYGILAVTLDTGEQQRIPYAVDVEIIDGCFVESGA